MGYDQLDFGDRPDGFGFSLVSHFFRTVAKTQDFVSHGDMTKEKMNARSFHPLLLPLLFTVLPASGFFVWLFNNPDIFQTRNLGYLFTIFYPFILIGLIGIVFRKEWALMMLVPLWLNFVGWAWYELKSDIIRETTYFPRYWWLYYLIMLYFTLCLLSFMFALWQRSRLKRQC